MKQKSCEKCAENSIDRTFVKEEVSRKIRTEWTLLLNIRKILLQFQGHIMKKIGLGEFDTHWTY